MSGMIFGYEMQNYKYFRKKNGNKLSISVLFIEFCHFYNIK